MALTAHVQAQLEAEKARIARRLHGDVAGMLAAARMDLSRIAHAADADGELREQVARVDLILEAVIQNARTEMQRLHPALLDHFGLAAALRHLVEQASRAGGAEYTLELPDLADSDVAPPVALAAYRAVEAMLESRTLRRVLVRLRSAPARLMLQLTIEGAAVDAPQTPLQLQALRAWLEQLGARWKESERDAAVELELDLPRGPATTATPAP